MKKVFKTIFAVVAVAAVGFGSYRTYGSYMADNMSNEDLLLAENVLALSELTPSNGCNLKGWTGFCQGRRGGGHAICDSENGTQHCTIHCGVNHTH